MNLPRVLNSVADAYFALRLAGFTASEAQHIVTEEARNAVDRYRFDLTQLTQPTREDMTMPNMKDMYPSKWLTAKDLDGEDKTVTIRRIEEEEIGKEDKWVLYFDLRQTTKGLVLNQTNARKIAELLGEETDDWVNRQITLYPTEVQYKQDMVEAIRVRSKLPVPPKPKAAQPQPVAAKTKTAPLTQAEADESYDDSDDSDNPPF